MDPSVRPEKESECLVYSFGISNDWTFDEAMEQMGCRVVYAFDPSMNVDNHDHSSKIDAVDWEGYNAYEIVWFNSKLARTDATHSVLPSMVNKKKMYNPVNVNKKYNQYKTDVKKCYQNEKEEWIVEYNNTKLKLLVVL